MKFMHRQMPTSDFTMPAGSTETPSWQDHAFWEHAKRPSRVHGSLHLNPQSGMAEIEEELAIRL